MERKGSASIMIIGIALVMITGLTAYEFSGAAALKCTDSDGGKNFFVKGTASGPNRVKYTDACSSSDIIKEYYCAKNRVISTDQSCKSLGRSGCVDGACISTTTNTTLVCTDSDGGLNYDVAGSATNGQATQYDLCKIIPGANLIEGFCDGNIPKGMPHNCTNGCINNACIPQPQCVDSDGGANYDVKGTVTNSSGQFTDNCDAMGAPNFLNEFVCEGAAGRIDCNVTGKVCQDGACVAPAAPPPTPPPADNGTSTAVGTIFVTSTYQNGNIGGLSNADSKCQARASVVNFAGTWVALLSSNSTNAKDRIPDVTYKRVDGVVIANNKADLFDGTIQNPINKDESGKEIFADVVWTGSTTSGTADRHCNSWTTSSTSQLGTMGHTHPSNSWIAYSRDTLCSNNAHLYCVRVQ